VREHRRPCGCKADFSAPILRLGWVPRAPLVTTLVPPGPWGTGRFTDWCLKSATCWAGSSQETSQGSSCYPGGT
jgi:hypothetical protein